MTCPDCPKQIRPSSAREALAESGPASAVDWARNTIVAHCVWETAYASPNFGGLSLDFASSNELASRLLHGLVWHNEGLPIM